MADISTSLSLVYFPSAVVLGALHALEPGHAKTLTAAYLIGVKGTRRDAILLGLAVAATHSMVVIALAILALWFGKEAFTDSAMHGLQIGSGIFVVMLGLWMLVRRLKILRGSNSTHTHAPAAVVIRSRLAQGTLSIVQTADGERLVFALDGSLVANLNPMAKIFRENGAMEVLPLQLQADGKVFMSATAPAEPHEFSAVLELQLGTERETVSFAMHEPHTHAHDHGHGTDHDHLSDDEHARAHAATMPEYVKRGERPTMGQILAFGAAGGLMPCPASVTVMLLALSVGQAGLGLFTVFGFSIGLALTLVGMGLLVVAGLSTLGGSGRFTAFSRQAPVISAAMVILSGLFALFFAH